MLSTSLHITLTGQRQLGARQLVRMAASGNSGGSWQERIITSPSQISQIAAAAKTVAVLGCKTEKQADQPAFFVPEYLQRAGVNVIPVLTWYPDVTEVLGKKVVRKVSDIDEPYDILCVFRKPSDLPAHLDDILAAPHKPPVVWLQSGIHNPEFEQQLAEAGISVVYDQCLKVVRAGGHHSNL